MRNHTPVFHYIERRIVIIMNESGEFPPVGIPNHIVAAAVVVADVTIRVNEVRNAVVVDVRRAKPPKLLGQKLVYFRRNM